jgi:predicted dehydrogenase
VNITRRSVLKSSAVLAAGAALSRFPSLRAADAAGRKLRVAVVGLGRGLSLVRTLLTLPDVEIAYIAEVDPNRLAAGAKTISAKSSGGCGTVTDFRRILEDKTVDAIFIAMPNFWHTPAALLAMQAGKHVYVEKPGSQNPHEAELIVAAQKKYGRVVQMGNQRRTWMKEAIEALHGGVIGRTRFGRAFYYNDTTKRGAVGKNARRAPADLDWNLWQGPVPDEGQRDMKSYVHYDWHWLWHWGNGELGNNGVHCLDILRWGLRADYAERITYLGNRYWFEDEQQTPDTGTAVYDFGEKGGCEWVQSSCHPRLAEVPRAEIMFYGEGGTMGINFDRDSWTLFDPAGKEVSRGRGKGGGDAAHVGNFLDAVRGNARLNSPIDEGQKSTMMCHLGNIAYRTSTVVRCDPTTGKLIENPAGEKLWQRESYRKGFEPKI